MFPDKFPRLGAIGELRTYYPLRLGYNVPQLDQIEYPCRQGEVEVDLLQAYMPKLSESGNHLGPAKVLFDLLSVPDALFVTGMPDGASSMAVPFFLPATWGVTPSSRRSST